jgi:hypothetical protein
MLYQYPQCPPNARESSAVAKSFLARSVATSRRDLIEATECLKAWWGCGMIVQWAAAASTTRLIRAETRIFLFHSLPFYCDGASWSLSPLWAQEPSFEHPPEIARTHRKKTKQAFHPTCLRVPPSPICVMPSRSYNLPFGIPLSLPQ